MNEAEALTLVRGERIWVKRPGRTRSRLAVVTGTPWTVGPLIDGSTRTVFTYAYVKVDTGPGIETLSRRDHTAVVPGDYIVREPIR